MQQGTTCTSVLIEESIQEEMESNEVIDIDELLGDAPEERLETPEEYDFEGYLDSALCQGNGSDFDPRQKEISHCDSDKNDGAGKANISTATSVNPDSSFTNSEQGVSALYGNHSNSKTDKISPAQIGMDGGGQDRISPLEKMKTNMPQDAILNGLSLGNTTRNHTLDSMGAEEDVVFDVNSEELKQFILEFQQENNKAMAVNAIDLKPSAHGAREQTDNDSLSSLSTWESHDSSLSSSLTSGDIHASPDKVKVSKATKVKSMRFLMSSLLHKNRVQQQNQMLGSEDECRKDVKKIKIRKKEEKPRTVQSPRKETSSSTEKLRQILGSGDWERMPVNRLPIKFQAERESQLKESSLSKQVLQAAAKGDQQILEFLLLANRDLAVVRDARGNTLLHKVCTHGHIDCLKWLATGFCSGLLSMENNDCFTPADLAVQHGHLKCVVWLVQETECKSELHPQDNRWSLLHVAARFGQECCLRWLLGHMQVEDIPFELIDHNDNTPAHLASKYGYLNCLQTLVEFNADITMVNKKKQTPCILATKFHHEMCAQFLVIVETCITLSAQVTSLQRQLRESHEDQQVLKHKLKDTLSCTEAVVKMHKATDTLERVHQVHQEYVGLTNLLVKKLDDVHIEHKATEDVKDDSDKAAAQEEVSETKRKAVKLQQACQTLLEEENRHRVGQGNQLQKIKDELSNMQLPTSPRAPWTMDDPTHTLEHMRARLSQISHGLEVKGTSLSEESVDNLSLSSSYASSFSSSCSSLATLMRSSGSPRGCRRRKVTWTDDCGQIGMVLPIDGNTSHMSSMNVMTSHRPQSLHRLQTSTPSCISSPEIDTSSSSSSQSFKTQTNNLVQYHGSSKQDFTRKLDKFKEWFLTSNSHNLEDSRKQEVSKWSSQKNAKPCFNCENGCETDDSHSSDGKCDVTIAAGRLSGMVKNGDVVDLLVSSQECQIKKSNYYVNSSQGRISHSVLHSKPDRTKQSADQLNAVQKSKADVPPRHFATDLPVKFEAGKTSRSLLSDEILKGCHLTPEQFKKDVSNNGSCEGDDADNRLSDSSEDEDDPFRYRNVRAMQEAMKLMRPVPIVEKIGNSTENLHILFAKHLPSHKYDVMKDVPDYMRKVQWTGKYGESPSRLSVKTKGEKNIVLPKLNVADKRDHTLKRNNSDSSASSTSSDAPWSESDQQESSLQERHSRRSGILNMNKKSGDGKKSKSEKHITFALDSDTGDKESQNKKSFSSKRRDLSPIYERPDLLRLSHDASNQNTQTTTNLKVNRAVLPINEDSGKKLEERLYRLFSYSSDDDYESSCNSEDNIIGGGHVARQDQYRMAKRIPPGLSDHTSPEFKAISDEPSSRRVDINANGSRMWYESSEEEEEGLEDVDDNSLHSLQNLTGSFDRRICYL